MYKSTRLSAAMQNLPEAAQDPITWHGPSQRAEEACSSRYSNVIADRSYLCHMFWACAAPCCRTRNSRASTELPEQSQMVPCAVITAWDVESCSLTPKFPPPAADAARHSGCRSSADHSFMIVDKLTHMQLRYGRPINRCISPGSHPLNHARPRGRHKT